MATLTKGYSASDFANGSTQVGTVIETALDLIIDDYNGGVTDANISASAAIQQSKIANLTTNLAARLSDTGDTITGELKIKYATPAIRWKGTEGSAKDWQLVESASDLLFQENTGTEGSPTWTTRYSLPDGSGGPATNTDLTTKLYVDDLTSSLGFGKTTLSSGDVTSTSTSFEDVTGLTVSMTNKNANRVIINVIVSIKGGSASTIALDLHIDGSSAAGTGGLVETIVAAGDQHNMSFMFTTTAQTAASHTYKIRIKVSAGTATLRADSVVNAIIEAREEAMG